MQRVSSQLVLTECHTPLQSHPDKQFEHYILTCIIGFSDTEVTCYLAECNLSANSNPEVVSKYLVEAVALGWVSYADASSAH